MTQLLDYVFEEESFQYWLSAMDESLDALFSEFPGAIRAKLDFSVCSLKVLEESILDRIGTLDEGLGESDRSFLDGASRYVGETIRRILGGKWVIDLSDSESVNFGKPVVSDSQGRVSDTCPLLLVTASLDRRTGEYIFSVVSHLQERSKDGFSDLLAIRDRLGISS
jgi:hypothetical protein